MKVNRDIVNTQVDNLVTAHKTRHYEEMDRLAGWFERNGIDVTVFPNNLIGWQSEWEYTEDGPIGIEYEG